VIVHNSAIRIPIAFPEVLDAHANSWAGKGFGILETMLISQLGGEKEKDGNLRETRK
jgi:hypothetical protein